MSAGKCNNKDDTKEEEAEEVEEVQNILSVGALRDVADDIVTWTSRKDLAMFAQVCRAWREIATPEKLKRYFIHHFPLHYNADEPSSPFAIASSRLNVEPQVSLLIYDERVVLLHQDWLNTTKENNPERDVCIRLLNHYKRDVPNRSVAMKVTSILTSRESQCGLIGIFFPSMENRNTITMAHIPYSPSLEMVFEPNNWINDCTSHLIRELGLDNADDPKCCILILVQTHDPFAAASVYMLKTTVARIRDGIDDVWIGELARWPIKASSNPQHHQNSPYILVALKITGPDLESYTATIQLSQSPEAVRKKLTELKKKVVLKKYRTGFISGPSTNEHDAAFKNSQLIMNVVNEIFPNVPFVGLFGGHKNTPYCFSASPKELLETKKNKGNFQRTVEYRSISIIIITYD